MASSKQDFEALISSLETLAENMKDKKLEDRLDKIMSAMEQSVNRGAIDYEKANNMLTSLEGLVTQQTQALQNLSTSITTQTDYDSKRLAQDLQGELKRKTTDFQEVMGKIPSKAEIEQLLMSILDATKKYDKLEPGSITRRPDGTVASVDRSRFKIDNIVDDTEKVLQLAEQINAECKTTEDSLKNQNEILKQNEKSLNKILGIIKTVWREVKKGVDQWQLLDDETVKWGRNLGLTEKQAEGFRTRTLRTYGELSMQFGLTAKEILAFQTKYNEAVNTSIQLSTDHLKTVMGVARFAGDQASTEAVINMDKFGASAEIASLHLAKAHEQAALSGLNAKKTSEAFAKNVKMASQYTFREGVNGVAKMTMLSEKLRFNLESLGGVIDKFSTIEGAIENSAKLQVLGGQFAQAFGNPLDALHDALVDAEGFTDRVIGSFQNLAYFDEKKGMMDMSAIDKMRLKQAAQQMGLSYEDAWNMATQKGKADVIGKNIQNGITDQKDKDWITNNAVYDGRDWVVNYTDEEGNEITKKVVELDKESLRIARNRATKEDIMADDISALREYVVGYIKEQGYTSQKEKQTGILDGTKTILAKWLDPVMKAWGGILKTVQGYPTATAAALTGGSLIGGIWGKQWLSKYLTRGGSPNMIKNFGQNIKNVGSKIASHASHAWGKIPKAGKWGIAAAAAIGAGYLLTRGGNGGSQGQPQGQDASTAKPQSQYANQGSSGSRVGYREEARQALEVGEKRDAGTQIDDGIKNALLGTTALQWGAKKVLGKRAIHGLYKTTAKALGKNVAKGIFRGPAAMTTGPLGLIGAGVGFATDLSSEYLKNNGNETAGKVVGIGGKMGEYALYGAALASVIPGLGTALGAGVGAVVGGAIGVVQQYGDEIKEFASGTTKAIGKFADASVHAIFGGGDSRNEEEIADEDRETMKFGRVGANDPALAVKRDMAILKMHDLLISMWYHMNGKQSNGREKEGSWLLPTTWLKKAYNWLTGEEDTKQKVDIQHFASGGVIKGSQSDGDSTPIKATAGEAVITPEQFKSLEVVSQFAANQISTINRDTTIKPTKEIGEKVEIKAPSLESPKIQSISQNIGVHLDGSIRLEANGGNATIDANQLLKNSQFMSQLIDMVQRSMRLHNTNGMGDTTSGVGFGEFKAHQVRM